MKSLKYIAITFICVFVQLASAQVNPEEFISYVEKNLSRVDEFKFIQNYAHEQNIRVWLFGGTAAGFAHYAKWDLQRIAGDQRFQRERFDYDITNIYRSNQDLDIVIDGTVEQAIALESTLAQKFPHVKGSKTSWEVRLLTSQRDEKLPLLDNPDFLNQHTDSNSTGLIELTQFQNEDRIRDLRQWKEKNNFFLKDVLTGQLHYYFSDAHETTKFFKEGRNPPILSVIRFLTKAFQYELHIRQEDLNQIKKVIEDFEPTSLKEHSYNLTWLENNAAKLVQNAVNIEYALKVLSDLGLREKLIRTGDSNLINSYAWWLNKQALETLPLGQGVGRTAQSLGIDVVSHETNSFEAWESITRSHQGQPNVFISRSDYRGETAAHGDGFYVRKGREGARGTGLTIRFQLNPKARENSDFLVKHDYVIVLNKAALVVIPEYLDFSLEQYFNFILAQKIKASDGGILEKLKRRIGKKLNAFSDTEFLNLIQSIHKMIDENPQEKVVLAKELNAIIVASKKPEELVQFLRSLNGVQKNELDKIVIPAFVATQVLIALEDQKPLHTFFKQERFNLEQLQGFIIAYGDQKILDLLRKYPLSDLEEIAQSKLPRLELLAMAVKVESYQSLTELDQAVRFRNLLATRTEAARYLIKHLAARYRTGQLSYTSEMFQLLYNPLASELPEVYMSHLKNQQEFLDFFKRYEKTFHDLEGLINYLVQNKANPAIKKIFRLEDTKIIIDRLAVFDRGRDLSVMRIEMSLTFEDFKLGLKGLSDWMSIRKPGNNTRGATLMHTDFLIFEEALPVWLKIYGPFSAEQVAQLAEMNLIHHDFVAQTLARHISVNNLQLSPSQWGRFFEVSNFQNFEVLFKRLIQEEKLSTKDLSLRALIRLDREVGNLEAEIKSRIRTKQDLENYLSYKLEPAIGQNRAVHKADAFQAVEWAVQKQHSLLEGLPMVSLIDLFKRSPKLVSSVNDNFYALLLARCQNINEFNQTVWASLRIQLGDSPEAPLASKFIFSSSENQKQVEELIFNKLNSFLDSGKLDKVNIHSMVSVISNAKLYELYARLIFKVFESDIERWKTSFYASENYQLLGNFYRFESELFDTAVIKDDLTEKLWLSLLQNPSRIEGQNLSRIAQFRILLRSKDRDNLFVRQGLMYSKNPQVWLALTKSPEGLSDAQQRELNFIFSSKLEDFKKLKPSDVELKQMLKFVNDEGRAGLAKWIYPLVSPFKKAPEVINFKLKCQNLFL